MSEAIAGALAFLESLEGRVRKDKDTPFSRFRDFKPFPSQERFLLSDAIEKAAFGPNRAGKTFPCGWLVAAHIRGDYPDWFPVGQRLFPGELRNRPVKIRCGGETFEHAINQVILPSIRQWIPEDLYEETDIRRNAQGNVVGWDFNNGASIQFITYAMDIRRWEGWWGHFAWLDEPPPEDRYIASMRGLIDYDGRMIMSLTPLFCAWVEKRFSEDPERERRFKTRPHLIPRGFTFPLSENSQLKEERKEHWLDLLGESSEEVKAARGEGVAMSAIGKVYTNFEETRRTAEGGIRQWHAVDPFRLKQEDYTVWHGLDPHDKRPHAQLWLAVKKPDKKGLCEKIVCWEDFNRPTTVEQCSKLIRAIETDLMLSVFTSKPFIFARYIDPRKGLTPDAGSKMTLVDQFGEEGYKIEYPIAFSIPAYTDIITGHSLVRTWMDNVLADGTPEFKVFRTCRKTIDSLKHYGYDPKSNFSRLEEKYKDLPDLLRYLALARPCYVDPKEFLVDVDEDREDTDVRPWRKKAGEDEDTWPWGDDAE